MQDLPFETCREVLREFLYAAGLIAHRFPGKPQDLQLKGIEFFGGQIRHDVLDLGIRQPLVSQSLGCLGSRKPHNPDPAPPRQRQAP